MRSLILLVTIGAAASAEAQTALPWDVSAPPTSQASVYYFDASGGQRGVPVNSGDFNGDGFLDVAGSPFSASVDSSVNNGRAIVLFGDGTINGVTNVETYAGPKLTINGVEPNSMLGIEMATRDLDGDGYTDLVLGSAHGINRSIAYAAGEVIILFGNADWGGAITSIDLRNPPAGQRLKVYVGDQESLHTSCGDGRQGGDRLGAWFSVGDLDGDGELDLVMSMDLSDGAAGNNEDAGGVAIAWSVATAHSDLPYIRVGDPDTADSLTVIYGEDAFDTFGNTHTIADLDGDGALDLIGTAGVSRSGLFNTSLCYSGTAGGDGPDNHRSNAGEVTIFWNAANLKQYRTLSLHNGLPAGVNTTTIYGPYANDWFGEELVHGDLDGDGVTDLIAGALGGNSPTGTTGGAAYVLYGGAALRGTVVLDLLAPPATMVTAIYGSQPGGIAGDTLEMADINLDGIDDLFYAVPYGDPFGRNRAGYTTVLYGGQSFPRMPGGIYVDESPTPHFNYAFLAGDDPDDFFAYSTALGDMNGDGTLDYIPNAMQGDGINNTRTNAGEYYVLDGLLISRRASQPMNPRPGTSPAIATWDIPQPIFGPITGYELTFQPLAGGALSTVTVPTNAAAAGNFAESGNIVAVTALMDRAGTTERSLPSAFTPPIAVSVVAPTPSPEPTPTPEPTATPIASETPTATETPVSTGTPTPSPSATPTASPTATPTPLLDIDFDGESTDWTTVSTDVFDAPAFRQENGALVMEAWSDNTFGFWNSPVIDIHGLEKGATTTIHQVNFTVSADQADPLPNSTLRVRMNSQNLDYADVLVSEPQGDGAFSPTAVPRIYSILAYDYLNEFGAQDVTLSFDVLNLLPLDRASRTLSLEDVTITSIAETNLADVFSQDFTGSQSHDWALGSGAPLLPVNGRVTGDGLELGGVNDTVEGGGSYFGSWSSPAGGNLFTIEGGAYYIVNFFVKADQETIDRGTQIPTLRFRVNTADLSFSRYMAVESITGMSFPYLGYAPAYPVRFIAPPELDGKELIFSFDYISAANSGDDPTIPITLQKVTISAPRSLRTTRE